MIYDKDHECPKCEKLSGWYRIQAERAYSCGNCGHHLHPTAGTMFERSRTSLLLWFYAIYLFTTTRHGVPAKELQRQLGVTYKTAWRIGHQIRKHMAEIDGDVCLSGKVEIDETMVGGKSRDGKRGRGAPGETVVFGMMQCEGGVSTKVVPNVKRNTLQPIIENSVEKGSTIYTDELRSHQNFSSKGYHHGIVEHGTYQFADGDIHVNSIEGYWSQLKRSIRGTHIHVSGKHLNKYSGEFDYRFNRCRNDGKSVFLELISVF